ncbi:hypothetical protein TSMEX_002932 [Taenia solium]|eukprot:TsM_000087200 transcript=TsM_000087200 gene=TsM_000087200
MSSTAHAISSSVTHHYCASAVVLSTVCLLLPIKRVPLYTTPHHTAPHQTVPTIRHATPTTLLACLSSSPSDNPLTRQPASPPPHFRAHQPNMQFIGIVIPTAAMR